MQISYIALIGTLLTSFFATAQPPPLDYLHINLMSFSKNPCSDNFSVYGIQTNYWLENSQGEIPMTVTTQENLLITVYIYDQYNNEKAQTATLINNRAKGMTLLLEDFSAGNYRLVVTSLNTQHQLVIKTYYMTLTNMTSEDLSY
ncbi:N-acetylglucosamine-binding protein A [Yersinia frederiksenii]|uniref:hypothetical protein n=1 Tax=Yersinia frederiksenii TaxID=29484 RepID=UPI0005DDC92A|nr:hypothetical protein [Yersinia frederiksenii]CNB45978.1 N-acetylglucosamine-binding protein A [Yersinia frederiksenii]